MVVNMSEIFYIKTVYLEKFNVFVKIFSQGGSYRFSVAALENSTEWLPLCVNSSGDEMVLSYFPPIFCRGRFGKWLALSTLYLVDDLIKRCQNMVPIAVYSGSRSFLYVPYRIVGGG